MEEQNRWSKYLDKVNEGQADEKAEEEEEDVFMDRSQICGNRNVKYVYDSTIITFTELGQRMFMFIDSWCHSCVVES